MSAAAVSERVLPAMSRAGRPKASALVIGPLPPPYHGGSVATRNLLSSAVGQQFRLIHLDTTDRRGLENIGRLDAGNVVLAFAHFWRYLRLLRRERPELVYVPLAQSCPGFLRDALFLLPARMLRKRVIVHFHGGGFRDFYERIDPLTRIVVRASLRSVSRAIVLGQRLRVMVAEVVPPARVAVVPNGIEDPYGGKLCRDPPPQSGGRVVYLGTLMADKGFLDVLAAAAILAPQRPHLRYTLAGDFCRPSDRARAESYLQNGLRERVELAGVVEGAVKAEMLRAAEIFVFPSYAHEGHPYVILEAMAAGLPIITTARAASTDTIIDDETGVIVPERDPHALAEAIGRLAGDPVLRARLGAAARERYLQRYTLGAWAADMTTAFEDALVAQ